MAEVARVPWRIVGEEIGGCNCAWGCPCQFNALPTTGRCEGIFACRIREGHFGGTRLDGVVAAGAYWWPGAIHEGRGIMRFAVDERATPAQRDAMLQIVSGRHGGALFEIFASVVSTVLDPLFVPITLDADREGRIATLEVPGLCELRAEPIRNPVTGEEHRAIIKLPNGFEYKEAEVGNTVYLRATLGDKTYENRNTYAQFAAVEWSNG